MELISRRRRGQRGVAAGRHLMTSSCTLIARWLTHSWHMHLGTCSAHGGLEQGTRRLV